MSPVSSRASAPTLAVLLVCAAILLRVVLAVRPGLWGDEIFSLAIATGHSLEHPAASALGDLGDFVQPTGVVPSSSFVRFAEPEPATGGVGGIVRAVRLSDTNPPLYYLLLGAWTRVTGSSDAALRLLSLVWAVLTLPVLWLLATELGDRSIGWVAVVLYAWSPASMFYSLEGRMYSLMWLLATLLVWLTLRVARGGYRPAWSLAWVGTAVAGLYTHYFFLFVWLACGAWLLVRTRGRGRLAGAALLASAAAAAAPWYAQVPAALSQWRVTGAWLATPLRWPETVSRPFELAWSLLAGGSHWGGSPLVDGVLAVAYLGLGIWLLSRGRLGQLFTADRLLVWCWVAAVVLGPYMLDLVRQTGASRIPRYALAALPGALLLASLAAAPLAPRWRAGFTGLILLAWTAGLWPQLRSPRRPGAVYPALGAELSRWAAPGDLVLVHSVPSGVIGLSRALPRDLPFLVWIDPLGRRQVSDLPALLEGHNRVALVQVHNIGLASPAEPWLRRHGRLADHRIYDGTIDALSSDLESLTPDMRAALVEHRLVEIVYFEPTAGGWPSPDRR